METMTEQEFQNWIRQHRGERGREPVYESTEVLVDPARPDMGTRTERKMVGTKVTALDGAVIVVHRNPGSAGLPNAQGQSDPNQPDYIVASRMDAAPDASTQRTPEQSRSDAAIAEAKEAENRQKEEERVQRLWNQGLNADGTPHGDSRASGLPETHMERAEREAKEARDKQQAAQSQAAIAASQASTASTLAQIADKDKERSFTAEQNALTRGMTQQQIDIQREEANRRAREPKFLSQADAQSPFIVSATPDGTVTTVANPNYDAVKAAAEEKRKELASQIASRDISLREAQQQYTQWFDTNVKIPMAQAAEVRARAEERRAALEAEERRRQFAANFKLQKAQLGETAASRATNAEISLLPYRSGPTWGEDFSSAINSLAAGGKIDGPDASAGIHFSDSSFAFQRPDFKQIAREAAKAALSGLTDYRPSDEQYATGDYSGIPSIGGGGAYTYQPTALPEPSPGAAEPAY